MNKQVALIGFGEAASTFANAAQWRNAACAFDVLTSGADTRDTMLGAYAGASVVPCEALEDAISGASVILSLVTADSALAVAKACAALLTPGQFFFDMNSVAPQTKRAAAQAIEAVGARYVDVAIMAPVKPAHMAVPLLVSGADAGEAVDRLSVLGFTNTRIVSEDVGRASTIKMLRSVMYKGVEALTAECLLACERAGVTDQVLDSFNAGSAGSGDWASGADYRLDRMMAHGLRRAAEMVEAAKTLEDLGVEPLMTRGTIERQRQIGAHGIRRIPDTLKAKLERLTR